MVAPGCGVKVGVEEEFHIIDLESRHSAPEVAALLGQLHGEAFAPELLQSLVETNTAPVTELGALRAEVVRLRAELATAAGRLGLGVVAAGTAPMTGPQFGATDGNRFARMMAEYQVLAREQLICGAQVHVDVPDRDLAIAVVQYVAPWLPLLLALSASSPYWRGEDSGYASSRTLVWQRWPTSGPPTNVRTAAEYDRMVADLVASNTISDPGMVYFDVRPSNHLPTLELRVCDACPSVDNVVLIAGLFRAMVIKAVDQVRRDIPPPGIRHELLRAASWRAARSGLEGDLVDLLTPDGTPALVSPGTLFNRLLHQLREPLEQSGDWDEISTLTRQTVARGSAAARQRRIYGRRGELADVVDALLAETQGAQPLLRPMTESAGLPSILRGYRTTGFDEAITAEGRVRTEYAWMFRSLDLVGLGGLRVRELDRDREQRARGIFFKVDADDPGRLFPLDLVPRIVTADEWRTLEAGLTQRVRALEAFLQDAHGERAVIRDGIVPDEFVPADDPPSYPGVVRTAISGIDLVRDSQDRWLVLEDNLRVPSGIGYAMTGRRLVRSVLPELEPPAGVVPLDDVPEQLHKALLAAVPPNAAGPGRVALLSKGRSDAAFYEHRLLAEEMDVPLVVPAALVVRDGSLYRVWPGGSERLDVLYRRMDEHELRAAIGADGTPLGPPLTAAIRAGRISVVNAMGNGVADDKLIYSYVPAMIEYYLGEKPLLANVPTYPCRDPEQLADVLGRLDQLVLKPVDGYGGAGIVIGPQADEKELARLATKVRADPAGWVAQDPIALSTHPTVGNGVLEARSVDLRAFVLLGERAEVLPAALTRVAGPGTTIVNSSRGGGAKDTWILR